MTTGISNVSIQANPQAANENIGTLETDLESVLSALEIEEADFPRVDTTATTLTNSSGALRDGGLAAASCCIPPALAGLYAATGAATGAVGAAVLNRFGVEEFEGLARVAAEQGAVGGAVVGGSIGVLLSCCCCMGAALADGEGSSAASGNLMGSLVLSVLSNALGNAILSASGNDTTSQFEGFASSATGTATFAVAGGALACLSAICCAGFAAGYIANQS